MGCIGCGLSEGAPVADHVVLGVEKSAVVSSNETMSLLHQRLDHAGMEEIKRKVGHVEFGVKKYAAQLSTYDCVPCRMGKFRRMTYKSKTSRPERPLEKLFVDDVLADRGRGYEAQVGVPDVREVAVDRASEDTHPAAPCAVQGARMTCC
jgi:hypothetical protein